MAWRTVQQSGWPSWQIWLPAERHGVPCVRQGVASSVVVLKFPTRSSSYADSRVQLTGGRRAHNSRRGGVLSPHIPAASGMALHCLGWRRDGGDGRTRLVVMKGTRPAGLTSQDSPMQAWNRRPSPLRGFHRPLSRVRHVIHMRVGGTVSWN
jgi:hypothetical protein